VGGPVTIWSTLERTVAKPDRPLISPAAAGAGGSEPIYLGRDRAHLVPSVAEEPRGLGKNDPKPADADTSIEGIIREAAAEFGLDGDYLVSVAACESGLDPRAYNAAGYHGLFQYDEQTWAAYGDGSIWDPEAQAKTTAMLIADGQASRWPNCA
jgi:soluble lytic murein transglycosylase-like protein